MTEKKNLYHARIRNSLIGRKINDVFYQEIEYDSATESWNLDLMIHSVDMNVIFKLDNGKFIQIKWDNEFYCYGVGLENLDEGVKQSALKTINLNTNLLWTNIINKEITAITVLWDIDENAKETTFDKCKAVSTREFSIHVPQTWEIQFNFDNRLWISALEIKQDKKANFWADHLTLFFDNNGQEKYQLIKTASIRHSV